MFMVAGRFCSAAWDSRAVGEVVWAARRRGVPVVDLVVLRPGAPGTTRPGCAVGTRRTSQRFTQSPSPPVASCCSSGKSVEGADPMGNDPEEARATAARIWDRTPSSDPAVHQANQLRMVFSRIDCAPRWRERLGELHVPTLVVHGRADPFFPVGNGEVLAAEIPAARLLVLDDMGTALRHASADRVAAAMLAL